MTLERPERVLRLTVTFISGIRLYITPERDGFKAIYERLFEFMSTFLKTTELRED